MLGRRSKDHEPVAAAPSPAAAAVAPVGPVLVTVEVAVPAEELRSWFLDPRRWTRFQGRQAWIDPVLGGQLRVEMAPGVLIAGRFEEIGERRLVFTWGREGDVAMPAASTTVSVTIEPTGPSSSRVELVHEGLADRTLAEEHEGGWRYHLVRLGVAATGVTAETEVVDLFLAATAEPNGIARRGLLERTCAEDVEVADGNNSTAGIVSLASKLGRHVSDAPDDRLTRVGPVERVGALLRCDYAVRRGPDEEVERGQLVARIDGQHRLQAVSLFG